MDQLNHLVREAGQLPTDPSEIESHLLSHFASELGAREESVGGELQSDEDDLEIELQQKNVKFAKRGVSGKNEVSKSRARPRKPHEPKPFLSIGNIPPQKNKKLDPLRVAHDIRQPSFMSNPNVPFNTPSRMIGSRNSNMYPMSAASSEWNSVIPKQHKQRNALREMEPVGVQQNIHVTAPFKHNVSKPMARTKRPPSPGEELRGKTMAGTQMVAKVMAKQKPELTPRSAGKLLKGKLKPMTPVVVEGPNIRRCMGIVPQQQSYSASGSRTVNRRRQIISTMIEKNIFPTSNLRPQTVESLHRTSIASSLDENRMEEVKEEPIHSPDKSPVAPPPSAAVEDVPSEPGNVNKLGAMATQERDMDAHGRSASFFVTESEEAENMPESERSSFKGLESEVASRPRTAVDSQSRKVHFADMEQNSSDTARRSRSAVARLHMKSAPQQNKKLRKEEQGQGDRVSTTPMAVVASDDQAVSKETDLVKSGEMSAMDDQQQEEGNTNNNGNQERRQPLQMAVTDVRRGFNGVDPGEKRGRPSVGRPKARRGQWEDPQKPDPYVRDLNINTCKPGTNVTGNRTGSYSMRKSLTSAKTGSRNGSRSRPHSAGGPTSFLLQEKRRTINTARPRSAYVQTSPGMQVESYGAQLNQRDRPNSACVSYAVPKPRRGRKAYTNVDITEYDKDLDDSQRERIALAHYVQNSRVEVCEMCARSSFRCTEMNGRMICETCSSGNMKETDEKPLMAATDGVVQNIQSESNEKENKGQEEESQELLIDMGDIESSLNQVQQEIQASRVKNELDLYCNFDNFGEEPSSPQDARTPFDMLEREASRASAAKTDGNKYDSNLDIIDVNSPFDVFQPNPMSVSGIGLEPNMLLCEDISHFEGGQPSGVENVEIPFDRMQQQSIIPQPSRTGVGNTEKSHENDDLELDPMASRNYVTSDQRPGSRSSFLENVLNLDDTQQQGSASNPEKVKTYTDPASEEKACPSNMTVYQYAEVEEDQGSTDTTTAGKHEPSRGTLRTEGGQSGGIIEGQISSYRTNLIQPYVEEVYMSDITGSRSGLTPTLPASPYPPLCFHVNARPPAGHVYYFAYGVDMNPSRFATYIGHEVEERYWGLLFGFKLAFNRKGVDQDAIGFPNIQSALNSSVEGALYLLKTEELEMVDGHMGYPEYVEKVMLPVWFLNCTEPDELGVAQYCIPAVTYVARDAWTLRDMKGVSTEFSVRQCVRGADLVSPAYKEYIISQIT